MPLYEYQCNSCRERVEKSFLLAKYDTLVMCPSCGGRMTKILFPPTRFYKSGKDRLWGTSFTSSSEKFKEKQRLKGAKKKTQL